MKERPVDAEEVAEWLATASRRERCRLYKEHPEAAHPDVVRRLLERAWQLRTSNPSEAERRTRRALENALCAMRTFPRKAIAADLCAESLATLATLARLGGRFPRAEQLWRKVDLALHRGTGDKDLLVELLGQRASLRRAQRRFLEAQDLLRLALRWQAELEDDHQEGKFHVALGMVYHRTGETQKAFDEVLRALELLCPERDPELHLRAVHNSALYLAELGRHEQALLMIGACEPAYFLLGNERIQLHGRWVKGRLHARCQEPEVAELYLDRARRGFQEKGLAYEAALATLDLALIHAERHDYRKVKQLVEEMYPVFIDKAIPREASASLILFADSARKSGAGAEQIRRLIDQLHALRLH